MTEIELKLTPLDPGLLDRLAELTAFGAFEVAARRREQQRNSFFDTPSKALRGAHLGFRRRVVEGQSMATWTLKADTVVVRGIATRPEVELVLGADMPPMLALQALSGRADAAMREHVRDALADGSLPLAVPFLESLTQRELRDLTSGATRLELALDRVTLVGWPEYHEEEIEVELKRGDEAELHTARRAIEAVGAVRESHGSKLSRALDYVERNATSRR